MNDVGVSLSGLRHAGARRSDGPIRRLVNSRALTSLFVVLLILVGSCLYIWQRVRAIELLDDVQRLELVSRHYRDALAKVDADVSELSRIGRITKLAEERFGLKPTPLDQLYALRFEENIVGENGARQLWEAIRRSVARLPKIESNEAYAEELFDDER